MANKVIEASYPIAFRKKESSELGGYLKSRNSVVLVGMKRVGISNFLRFFLNHKDIIKTYLGEEKRHLFIPVDLNNLVEREIFPFWILTLKRILDAAEKYSLPSAVKLYTERLFLDSMQSKDIFLTIENIRKSLVKLSELLIFPTIFFIRFDRIKDVVTPQFFSNLHGLIEATNHQLAYVFTSFRDLKGLVPESFSRSSLSLFSKNMFIKPAERKDMEVIFRTYKGNYKISLSKDLEDLLFETVDGYVQYLQLALATLHEIDKKFLNKNDLFDFLSSDERIGLQSEELWESLGKEEKQVLLKITEGREVGQEEKQKAAYLWDTGFVIEKGLSSGRRDRKHEIFSKLFSVYLEKIQENNQSSSIDLTKKENLLFTFLKSNLGNLCERERIIEAVWPEVEALGVSDWAIDRLAARVRNKLKLQTSKFEIQTIKTRGYKLVEA